MFKCPKCESELQDDFSVCPYCGLQLYKKKSGSSKLVWAIIIGIVIAAIILAIGKSVLSAASRQEYMDAVQSCGYDMNQGMMQAEDAYNIIVSVWYNSIFNNEDPETDRFTKDKNGRFYDDFNDALGNVFADESFKKRLFLLNENKEKVEEKMRGLNNPPSGLENLHANALDVYQEYDILINSVLDPKGNYESYTSKFKDADESAAEKLKRLSMYFQ